MTQVHSPLSKRRTLRTLSQIGLLGMTGGFLSAGANAQSGRALVNLQLGWLAGNNQVGEIVAKQMGYYAAEGLDIAIQPGGPSIDGLAVVASGRFEAGQISSSPSLMLAASQDIPVKAFAAGLQQHPYAFFSLKQKPIRSARDMVGKKIGIQATGLVLLRALLAKNGIPEKDVQIVTIGSDMAPLLTGQVDAVTGWLTNVTALKPLGPDRVDLLLWDSGVRLYALPYYATTETLTRKRDTVIRFVRATAKGWAYANANRDAAADMLVKEYPNLNRNDERVAIEALMSYCFNASTKAGGWGVMDPAVWQEQIALYAQLGQFTKRTPKLEEVMTMDILQATRDARMAG